MVVLLVHIGQLTFVLCTAKKFKLKIETHFFDFIATKSNLEKIEIFFFESRVQILRNSLSLLSLLAKVDLT